MHRDETKQSQVLPMLLIFLISFLIIGGSLYLNSHIKKDEDSIQEEKIIYADKKYKDLFEKYKEKAFKKEDYKCQIVFESGLINEPVFQGEDNDTYLRKDYQTNKYRVDGPVFMDYACDPNFDSNIILYGHNMPKSMDKESVQLFTPLHQLENINNYENNKIITIAYEDKIENYLVCYIYKVKSSGEGDEQYLVEGEPVYYLNNYSPSEFEEYINEVEKRKLYDTNEKILITDKLLTLQTCYETNDDKLIVLSKRIETLYYDPSSK